MLDGCLALPEGRHRTTWPWAQSQSQWPIGRQPQPRGGHSCWLPGPENRSFSGSAQGWHLLNLQVKVKCHCLSEVLPDYPSKVAQRPKAQPRRQSPELGRSRSPDNMVESHTSMLMIIKCLLGSNHS